MFRQPGGYFFPRRVRLIFRALLVTPIALYLGKDAYEYGTHELEYSHGTCVGLQFSPKGRKFYTNYRLFR